jgi:biotin operon repressor
MGWFAGLPVGTLISVSKGIGKTQQRILDALADEKKYLPLTVPDLAERIGCSERQIRRAVHSLEDRGLVVITRENMRWKGYGEYGRLARKHWPWDEDALVVLTVKAGEPWPIQFRGPGWRASSDTEFYYGGVPTPGLLVWLPEQRIAHLEHRLSLARQLGSAGSPETRAEYERLTGNSPPPRTITIPKM